jgi:hypothetical protein
MPFSMSVRLSTCINGGLFGRISVKFCVQASMKICPRSPRSVKIGQKYRTLYVKAQYVLLLPVTLHHHKSTHFGWYRIRLLARSCVRGLSTCISAANNGWIYVKFDTGAFMKICREIPNLVKIGQKYRTLCMTTKVHFVYCCQRL